MADRNSTNCPIRVDLIPDDVVGLPEGSGTLGMTLAPGVKDWNWDRDMRTDMQRLREYWRTDVLVSLVEDHEHEHLKMSSYAEEAEASGIAVEMFPIVDINISREEQVEEFADLVGRIIGFLREGRNTVVHCRGGIGRTGTVVSCVLVGLGYDAEEAMRLASEARRADVPEAEGQKGYVRRFARSFRGRWSK